MDDGEGRGDWNKGKGKDGEWEMEKKSKGKINWKILNLQQLKNTFLRSVSLSLSFYSFLLIQPVVV